MYTKLNAKLRDDSAGVQAKKLLQSGWIPGVLYSKHTGSRMLQVEKNDLRSLFQKDHALIEIIVEQETFLVSIKEIQSHPITQRVQHISFLAIKKGEKAEISLSIKLVGTALGAKTGGIINQLLNNVNIKCDPKDAPKSLELDISQMQEGDHLNLSNLVLPSQVELIDDPTQTIVSCTSPKVEEPAPAAEETPEGSDENKGKEKEGGEQKSEEKSDKTEKSSSEKKPK